MELPVIIQLRELAAALLLGAVLGMWYDFLRPFRRGRASAVGADLLFSVTTLAALLAFTLYGGRGRLRIFALLGMCAGGTLYFLSVSRFLRRGWERLIRLISAPLRAGKRTIKIIAGKTKKFCRKSKKIVAKRKKTGKIKNRQTMRKSRRKEACRVKLKKTSLLTKLLILAVVIYALVTLVGLQDRIADANAEVARLEEQVLYAEQNYALIEQDLEDLGSDQSVKKIARTRLGMVEAGEIVFHDGDVQD